MRENSEPISSMKRKIGRPLGSGRKKGTPNKRNVELKDMTLKALKLAGGTRYLAEQAKLNPSAFLTLLGKILPMQVNQQSDNVVKHVLSFDIPAQDAPILAQFKDLGSNEPALPQPAPSNDCIRLREEENTN